MVHLETLYHQRPPSVFSRNDILLHDLIIITKNRKVALTLYFKQIPKLLQFYPIITVVSFMAKKLIFKYSGRVHIPIQGHMVNLIIMSL